jgi:hypothetical protein
MAKLVTRSESFLENGQAKKLVEIRCDEIADVTPPDSEWTVGSIAWEITTGKFYGLTSDGTWADTIV